MIDLNYLRSPKRFAVLGGIFASITDATARELTRFILVSTIALVASSVQLKASNMVLPGWDLFKTDSGTSFNGVPFVGVPLNSFDFGSGAVSVDGVDTIVHRLDSATAPSETIQTELAALQLKSAIPVDFGLGLGTYYITLQSARGGPASDGQMTINFGPEPAVGDVHGTFDSFFDIFFDIRLGSLNGPIALSSDLKLSSAGTPWTHDPQSDGVLIQGVNFQLNGLNRDNDFFPLGIVDETHPSGAEHRVKTVPDGGATGVLLMIGILGVAGWQKKVRR